MADDHNHEVTIDNSLHAHVCTKKQFLGVFVALLILTILTVYVSRFDFGSFNMLIAMAIASVKASLVIAIFMHLRWDTPINNIAFLSSLIFLSLLFLFTFADFTTRGDFDPTMQLRAEVGDTFVWNEAAK